MVSASNHLTKWPWISGFCATLTLVMCAAGVMRAQTGEPPMEVLQLRPNFFMIVGAGANIGVQIGADGVVLVNAGSETGSRAVVEAVYRLTNRPIRFIIDTSADPDVVGGNAAVANAGRNIQTAPIRSTSERTTESITGHNVDAAQIIAHEAVLKRMIALSDQRVSSDAWPVIIFSEPRSYMYFNDEGIEILHQPSAHTDADSVVFFRRSDVVVAGNILDTTRFPIIDVDKGGSIQGEIRALNRLIELAIPPGPFVGLPRGENGGASLQPGGTEVVPGRGRVYRQIDVVNYRDMVVIIRDEIQRMIDRKMTLDQINAARPALAYETQYGATSGPWTTNDFVEAVYKSLTKVK